MVLNARTRAVLTKEDVAFIFILNNRQYGIVLAESYENLFLKQKTLLAKDVAVYFNVSPKAVRDLWNGRTWAWLTSPLEEFLLSRLHEGRATTVEDVRNFLSSIRRYACERSCKDEDEEREETAAADEEEDAGIVPLKQDNDFEEENQELFYENIWFRCPKSTLSFDSCFYMCAARTPQVQTKHTNAPSVRGYVVYFSFACK